MSEPNLPLGLNGLSQALDQALVSPQPDYKQIRHLLQGVLAQDLTGPLKALLLRALAATHVSLGDWDTACDVAGSAYRMMYERKALDVGLLIATARPYATILEGAGRMSEALSVVRTTVELARPHATPPELAQLLELRALAATHRIAPPPN